MDENKPRRLAGKPIRMAAFGLSIAALAAGCLISPVGSNKAGKEGSKAATAPVATPDESGKVVLKFTAKEDVEKATFTMRDQDDFSIADDDSNDEGFEAEIDTTKLENPGLYIVDAKDGDDKVIGTLTFIKPVPADAGSGSAASDTAK